MWCRQQACECDNTYIVSSSNFVVNLQESTEIVRPENVAPDSKGGHGVTGNVVPNQTEVLEHDSTEGVRPDCF